MADGTPRGGIGRIIWTAVATIGAPVIAGIGAYTFFHAGLAYVDSVSSFNSDSYEAAIYALEDRVTLLSVSIAAGAAFVIATMTLAFGKRTSMFAGIFGLIVGAVAGLGYAYYSGMTWTPGG